jgi:hypothetical protein
VHHDVQHVPAKTLNRVFCDRFLRLGVQGERGDAVESRLQRVHCVAVVAGKRLVPDKVSQVCTAERTCRVRNNRRALLRRARSSLDAALHKRQQRVPRPAPRRLIHRGGNALNRTVKLQANVDQIVCSGGGGGRVAFVPPLFL